MQIFSIACDTVTPTDIVDVSVGVGAT